jgi:hypothetical protein
MAFLSVVAYHEAEVVMSLICLFRTTLSYHFPLGVIIVYQA